jgi:hypothetical protein
MFAVAGVAPCTATIIVEGMSPVSRSRTKKSKSKPTAQAKGARRNGNPATRAGQTREADMAELRRLFGTETRDWWADSAENVLDACERLRDCDSPLTVENTVAAVFGTELAERLAAEHDGFDLPSWLVEVTDAAGRIATPPADSASARLLLHAIAASGTTRAAEAARGHLKRLRPTLSQTIADAYPWLSAPANGAVPTAAPLTVRNAYGDRWAVLVPFAIGGLPDTAHWYLWDIDACGTQRTVAAGVFDTAEAAVTEWRNAVGPTAATATPATTADIALLGELLSEHLRTGVFDGFLVGDEPTELLAEYFRSRNRATALLESVDPGGRRSRKSTRDRPTPEQIADVADRFADWCREHDQGPLPDRDSVYSLVDQWTSSKPSAWRYACSPHRVRTMAVILSDEYIDEYAQEMLALLPHWVTWCAEQTGLDSDLTERAVDTANLVSTPEAVRALDRPESDTVRIAE